MTEFIISYGVKNISSTREEKEKWIPWTHEPILKRENSSFANIIKIIDDVGGQPLLAYWTWQMSIKQRLLAMNGRHKKYIVTQRN